jgi:hypothetical protein
VTLAAAVTPRIVDEDVTGLVPWKSMRNYDFYVQD